MFVLLAMAARRRREPMGYWPCSINRRSVPGLWTLFGSYLWVVVDEVDGGGGGSVGGSVVVVRVRHCILLWRVHRRQRYTGRLRDIFDAAVQVCQWEEDGCWKSKDMAWPSAAKGGGATFM